jgi:hypothetical protein
MEQRFAELFDNYVLLVNAQRCLTPPTVSDIFDLTRLVPGKNLRLGPRMTIDLVSQLIFLVLKQTR